MDIAQKLNISEKTVRNHISNVMNKLDANSRAYALLELVKMKDDGLIDYDKNCFKIL